MYFCGAYGLVLLFGLLFRTEDNIEPKHQTLNKSYSPKPQTLNPLKLEALEASWLRLEAPHLATKSRKNLRARIIITIAEAI